MASTRAAPAWPERVFAAARSASLPPAACWRPPIAALSVAAYVLLGPTGYARALRSRRVAATRSQVWAKAAASGGGAARAPGATPSVVGRAYPVSMRSPEAAGGSRYRHACSPWAGSRTAVRGGGVPAGRPVARTTAAGSSVAFSAVAPRITPNATVGPERRPPRATATAPDRGRPRSAARATRVQPGGTPTLRSAPVTGRDPRTGIAPGTGRASPGPEPSVALVGSGAPLLVATATTASTAKASTATRRRMAPRPSPPRRGAGSAPSA